MSNMRLCLVILSIFALSVTSAFAGPGGNPGGPPGQKDKVVLVRPAGQVFCPTATLVAGNVIIPGGRCFMVSVLRDKQGSFLAFIPQGERIPPGQLVRLDTPAGVKMKGRLFLVPITTTTTVLRVNTVQLVPVQITTLGTQTTILVTGSIAPGVSAVFVIRP